jgi:periplasmic divalent cation tolerance protein
MCAQDYRLILNTCPDVAVAERLAGLLVEGGLAACVNIVPAISSVYMWQGKLQKDAEVLLLIKTTADNYDKVQQLILAEHPYELPEIVAVSFTDGLHGYFSWIKEVVKQ